MKVIKRCSVLVVCGLAFLAAVVVCFGQLGARSKADPRLREALNSAGLRYREMTNGTYALHFSLAGDRTHMVFVESKTTRMGLFEIRDVWAGAYKSQDLPSRETSAKLLLDSGTKKVGGWELHREKERGYAAIFTVKISADCDGEGLKSILFGVAETADEMEKGLSAEDNF